MKLIDICSLFAQNSPTLILVILLLLTLVEITPIKINPWGHLLRWFGRAINADITQRIDSIEIKLDTHIRESDERDVRNRRESILDFASAIANGRNYTKEQYEQMLKECDNYESYCERKDFPNSVADASINIIKDSYQEHFKNNTFLVNKFSVMVNLEESKNQEKKDK